MDDDARRHGPYYPPDRLIYAPPGTTIRVWRHRRIGAPPADFYRSTETWGPPATTAIYRRTCRARVAATSEAIAALPEVTRGEEEEECAVCLNDFRAGESLRAMPCSHAFHQQCISEWLRRSAACPLCRHRLPAAALTTEDEEFELEDSEEDDGGGGESG